MNFLALTLLTNPGPTPANFECDLLVVSTTRGLAETDNGLAWAISRFDQRVTDHFGPLQPPSSITSCQAAVDDLAKEAKSFVIIDGAGVKPSQYNAKLRRFLPVYQKWQFDEPGAKGIHTYGTQLELHKPDLGGVGGNISVQQDRNTRATGPHPIKNASWPTFSIMGIRDYLQSFAPTFGYQAVASAEANLALSISTLSVAQTAEMLDQAKVDYKNICFCAWGTQLPNRPNLIAFPPNGRAVRYKFGHKDGKWFANFVKAY